MRATINFPFQSYWNFKLPILLLVCSISIVQTNVVPEQNENANAVEAYYNSPLIRYKREPPVIYYSNSGHSGHSGPGFTSYDESSDSEEDNEVQPYTAQSQTRTRSSYRPSSVKTYYGPPTRVKYGGPSTSYKIPPSPSYGPPSKGVYGGKNKGEGGGGGAGKGIGDVISTKISLKQALINGIKAIKGGLLAMKGKFLKTKGNIIAAKGSLLEGFGQGIAGGGGGGGNGKSKSGLAGFGEIGTTLFSQISNLFTTLTGTFGQIFNINALGGLIGGFMDILGSFGRIGQLMVSGDDNSPVDLKNNDNGKNKEASSSSIIATVMQSLSQSINDMVEIMKGLNQTSSVRQDNIDNKAIKMSPTDWEDVVSEIMKDSPKTRPESENYLTNRGPTATATGYSTGISESGYNHNNNNEVMITSTGRDNNNNPNDNDINDILNMLELLKDKDDNPITVKELGLEIPKFRRIPSSEESKEESTTSSTTSTTTTEKPFSLTLSAEKPRFYNNDDPKDPNYVNATIIKDIFLDYFKRREAERNIVMATITPATSTSTTTTTTPLPAAEDHQLSKRRLYIIIINNQTQFGHEGHDKLDNSTINSTNNLTIV